jgi:ubiquinone/menaquinone biosynthesis C-methylase UbiE
MTAPARREKVLHHMAAHGLGDGVQFTTVIQHLHRLRPHQEQHVVTHRGKHSVFFGVADGVYIDSHPATYSLGFNQTYAHSWWEPNATYANSPGTKAVKTLRETFNITPIADLMRYVIHVGSEAKARVGEWIDRVLPANRPFVVLHYQGNTSKSAKDMPGALARELCQFLAAHEITVVVLDWDRRSNLPNNKTVFCPRGDDPLWLGYGNGDAETIAALMSRSSCNVTVDSGPGKIAAALPHVPCVTYWQGMHPVNFSDLDYGQVTHLVPDDHASYIRGDRATGLNYFLNNYQCWEYRAASLAADLCKLVVCRVRNLAIPKSSLVANEAPRPNLPDPPPTPTARTKLMTTANGFEKRYYDERRAGGLDYAHHGEWQTRYGEWLRDVFSLGDKDALDIGCACGSITLGLRKAGLRSVAGIDVSNFMIGLGRQRFRDLSLYVADAANMHLFESGSFDFVNAIQAAEYWNEKIVPSVAAEIYRVLRPGGVAFLVLDTLELYKRHNRKMPAPDAGLTIQSMEWWKEKFAAEGLAEAHDDWDVRAYKHPRSFFRLYDWDALVFTKPLVKT